MAITQKITHLSKLAFFLSLGLAATIIDACGGKSDDEGKDPESTGGKSSTNQSANTTAPEGGSSNTSSSTGGSTMGGASSVGGHSSTNQISIPINEPRDAGLWDVICE